MEEKAMVSSRSKICALPKILGLLTIAVILSASVSSCDDDEPYYSPITGTWQLTNAPGYNYNELVFYDNGFGEYYAYNDLGVWTMWETTWSINGSSLVIYITDTGQVWNYTWALRGYYLYLNDGYNQLVYQLA